ncbi:unnamed protein product [Brassica rapa]|uniref:Uncharacterized protein n=2 Tax=Brassica TaxID=3705 RepID=A0A8D9G4A6_BRACM|nr:unnamed protein product [Brassica napus]CAG7868785.1 unnamed protein product [Brassica rapa]
MSRHISEYDMGEGDLFIALEEAVLSTLSFFNNDLLRQRLCTSFESKPLINRSKIAW